MRKGKYLNDKERELLEETQRNLKKARTRNQIAMLINAITCLILVISMIISILK